MSIQPYGRGSLSRPVNRQTGRQLAHINGNTNLSIAAIESREDIQAAKLDTLAALTQHALQASAFASQVEQQLAQAVPLAATRLQGIGDVGALGMCQVLMDANDALRRI